MIIERNITPFSIRSDETISAALRKIDTNNEGFVFVLDDSGVLEGVLTDGDFRRWLLAKSSVDLEQKVGLVANNRFVSAGLHDKAETIAALFSAKIKFVPLSDERQRLVGLARQRQVMEGFQIGSHLISPESRCFIIAEIGINHNGSTENAKELILAAKSAGVDCVKFQMRNLGALYRNNNATNFSSEDLGAQYTQNMVAKF